MVVIDTSIWINVFKDKTGEYSQLLYEFIGDEDIWLTRFQQLELLQGSRNEREWQKLSDYLAVQDYLEASAHTWANAAKVFYTLRKKGLTVRSSLDCCIAQVVMEAQAVLLHDDRDFVAIGQYFPLQERYWPELLGS